MTEESIIENEEYYLIHENKAYKIIVYLYQSKILIKYKKYELQIDENYLESNLIKTKFKTIEENYIYINNIFEENKIYIKEIDYYKRIKLKINISKEENDIILLYNDNNKKHLSKNELINNSIYKGLKKKLNNLEEKLNILKEQYNETIIALNKESSFASNSISNYNNCPFYISYDKDLITDSFSHYALDNSFCVFESLNKILYIIYATRNKSIISYDFKANKKVNEIKNAHKEYITNIRHYLDRINNLDLVMSISADDNNIKVWNPNNWNILCEIKSINNKGSLYSAYFINDNSKIYIVTSNDNYNNSELIKIFDFNGSKIKEIKNSNHRTFLLDIYYDKNLNKNFIITGIYGSCISYDYNENKIYNNYLDEDVEPGDHDSIILINDDGLIKMIESSEDGYVRIWNFHFGDLMNKIFVSEMKLYGICLWNKDFIYVTCDDKTLKLVDLNRNIVVNNLTKNNDLINVKKVLHYEYGYCLITLEWRKNKIQLWINKI